MQDWLIGLSEHRKTDEDYLQESVNSLPISDLKKLAFDLDPLSSPTAVDDMSNKIGQAIRYGQELAHEQPELEKIAFLPALAAGAARLAPIAGRVLGGGGAKAIAGGIAKDMAVSAAGNKIMGALKPTASAAGDVAGGFKYAGVLSSLGNSGSGLLQRATAYTVKNPGTALTAAGAVGGALMAPRDQQTGEKQYLRGALMGGGAAAGVNAISNGSIANKMRSSVMNRSNPILGDRVRQYAMNSSAAVRGKTPVSTTLNGQTQYSRPTVPTSAGTSSPSVAPAAGYTGGPVAGNIKVAQNQFSLMSLAEQIIYVAKLDSLEKIANQQTLTYDPATKTFTRHHMNMDPWSGDPGMDQGSKDLARMGANPIPAGTAEPVKNNMTHAGPGLAPFGSPEYMQTRIERVRAKNGFNPDVSQPLRSKAAPMATPAPAAMSAAPSAAAPYGSREYFQQRLQQAGLGRAARPPIPTHVPGAVGGVAGIGAAAIKPATSGAGAVLGKALARR